MHRMQWMRHSSHSKGIHKLKQMMATEKYLVDIEFRYRDVPKYEEGGTSNSKTITIGVFDDFDEACKAGNKMLELLESKFPLHKFPDGSYAKKERFSRNGGCFGSKKDLITNLAYLTAPFEFYAHLKTLKLSPVEEALTEVNSAVARYRQYRRKQE